MWENGRASCVAQALYCQYVVGTGYHPPISYSELLLFVELSGAIVVACESAPPLFAGIQIGAWLYVSHADHYSERDRLQILAHEWCHWLRRNDVAYVPRLYDGNRDQEEEIARAFERLF